MGYTTEFVGHVTVTPPLNQQEIDFLNDLASTRRMNRTKGPLYVRGSGFMGQDHDDDVTSANSPHPDQPGLWLQWVPSDDGTTIAWDQGEKFYDSAEWMHYIVDRLLAPGAEDYIAEHIDEDPRLAHFTCDHEVEGFIEAFGEDPYDRWVLRVNKNVVSCAPGRVVYADEELAL